MTELAGERRLQIFETEHGRKGGWLIEHGDSSVALLTDLRRIDMFVDSYRVQPVTQDAAERQALMSSAELWREGRLRVRCQRFGDIAPHAVALGHPDPGDGRILMRGLYLPIGEPRPWERLLLRWRAFVSRGRK